MNNSSLVTRTMAPRGGRFVKLVAGALLALGIGIGSAFAETVTVTFHDWLGTSSYTRDYTVGEPYGAFKSWVTPVDQMLVGWFTQPKGSGGDRIVETMNATAEVTDIYQRCIHFDYCYYVVNDHGDTSVYTLTDASNPTVNKLIGLFSGPNQLQNALDAIQNDRNDGSGNFAEAVIIFGDWTDGPTGTYTAEEDALMFFYYEAVTHVRGKAVLPSSDLSYGFGNYMGGLVGVAAGATLHFEAEIEASSFDARNLNMVDGAKVTFDGGSYTMLSRNWGFLSGNGDYSSGIGVEMVFNAGRFRTVMALAGIAACQGGTVTINGGTFDLSAAVALFAGFGEGDGYTDPSLTVNGGTFSRAEVPAGLVVSELYYPGLDLAPGLNSPGFPCAWFSASHTATVTVNGGTFEGGAAAYASIRCLAMIAEVLTDGAENLQGILSTTSPEPTVTFNGGSFFNTMSGIVVGNDNDDVRIGAPSFNPYFQRDIFLYEGSTVTTAETFAGNYSVSFLPPWATSGFAVFGNFDGVIVGWLVGIADGSRDVSDLYSPESFAIVADAGIITPDGRVAVRDGAGHYGHFTAADLGGAFLKTDGDDIVFWVADGAVFSGNTLEAPLSSLTTPVFVEQTDQSLFVFPPDPTRVGYTFMGWFDNPTGHSGQWIGDQSIFDLANGAVQFIYAMWEPNVDYWADFGIRDEGWPFYDGYTYEDSEGRPCFDGIDTYYIYTPEQFGMFSRLVNGGNDFLNKTVVVMNDLNMYGHNWMPIGDAGGSWLYTFCGTFDGGGYAIRGISFVDESDFEIGLFRRLQSGSIENVNLVDCYMTGYGDEMGGIVGSLKNGAVVHCSVSGTVINRKYDTRAGGIVGYANESLIIGCHNTAEVSGESFIVGGIAGYASNSSEINHCSNAGTVWTSYYGGGLAGWTDIAIIQNCWNSGDVRATDPGAVLGGLVGRVNNGNIVNCYSSARRVDGNGFGLFGSYRNGGLHDDNCFWHESIADGNSNNCYAPDFTFGGAPGMLNDGSGMSLMEVLNDWVENENTNNGGDFTHWSLDGSYQLGARGYPVFDGQYVPPTGYEGWVVGSDPTYGDILYNHEGWVFTISKYKYPDPFQDICVMNCVQTPPVPMVLDFSGPIVRESDLEPIYFITEIGDGYGCILYDFESFATGLVLPDTVGMIRTSAFENCSAMEGALVIPDSVAVIGNAAFSFCAFDGALTIPDSVWSIGSGAFSYCAFNGPLTIGAGVQIIADEAFYGNTFDGSPLFIPDSVMFVGPYAFHGNTFSDVSSWGTLNTIFTAMFSETIFTTDTFVIPSQITSIGEDAFFYAIFGRDVVVGDSVKSFGARAFNYADFEKISLPSSSEVSFGELSFGGFHPRQWSVYYRGGYPNMSGVSPMFGDHFYYAVNNTVSYVRPAYTNAWNPYVFNGPITGSIDGAEWYGCPIVCADWDWDEPFLPLPEETWVHIDMIAVATSDVALEWAFAPVTNILKVTAYISEIHVSTNLVDWLPTPLTPVVTRGLLDDSVLVPKYLLPDSDRMFFRVKAVNK